MILMYHRIVDEPIDPWGLAVSPSHFEEQLQVLRRSRYPMSLSDFVRHYLEGSLPARAVAVTFDDGYADNFVAGKPRLAAADVPATVFLATGYIDRTDAFWWDELARLILVEQAPQRFEITINGDTMRFDFAAGPCAAAYGARRCASSTGRQVALLSLWQALRALEDEERRQIMVKLRSMLNFTGRDYRASAGRAMTSDEVRALLTDDLVTIGAHTVTHPVLSKLQPVACHREITGSKLTCEALIGGPVSSFSYPYGDYDAKVRETVKTAGFACAVSVRRAPTVATSDVLALPRIHVPNQGGDEFEQTLRFAAGDR
jgi:peptidoglycan/xylan/chitin deacetylase (PgdA/CDA1 family)